VVGISVSFQDANTVYSFVDGLSMHDERFFVNGFCICVHRLLALPSISCSKTCWNLKNVICFSYHCKGDLLQLFSMELHWLIIQHYAFFQIFDSKLSWKRSLYVFISWNVFLLCKFLVSKMHCLALILLIISQLFPRSIMPLKLQGSQMLWASGFQCGDLICNLLILIIVLLSLCTMLCLAQTNMQRWWETMKQHFIILEGTELIISNRKSASMLEVELDMMIIEIIVAYAKTKWDFTVQFIYSEIPFCFSIWTVWNPFCFLHSRHWNFLIPISPSQENNWSKWHHLKPKKIKCMDLDYKVLAVYWTHFLTFN